MRRHQTNSTSFGCSVLVHRGVAAEPGWRGAGCVVNDHQEYLNSSANKWHVLLLAVFMGMGEPLLNLAGVLPAITHLNGAMGIGARHITVSTVGVPNAIGAALAFADGVYMEPEVDIAVFTGTRVPASSPPVTRCRTSSATAANATSAPAIAHQPAAT